MLKLNKLYQMDCMAGMPHFPDNYFDLAIIDPPYGGGRGHSGKNRSGYAVQKNGSKLYVVSPFYKDKDWDNAPPDAAYFDELFRVSRHQIIWGINYMPENFGPGRIVWDKCNRGSAQSDCEIAYNSLTRRVDLFRYMWRGFMQGRNEFEGHIQQGNKKLNEKRIHPTQKPVALYRWLLRNYAKPGDKILDTHAGSASSFLAAYELGFNYVGFEIDEEYHAAASARVDEYMAAISMGKGG